MNTSNPNHILAQLKEKKILNHEINSSVCVSVRAAARWKVKSWRKQQTFTIVHIIEEHKVLTKQFPLLSFFLEFNKRWEAGRSIYNDKCASQGHDTIVQPQNPTVVMQTVKLKTHSDRYSILNDYVNAFLNLFLPKGKMSISEYKGKHKERTEQDNEPSNNRLSALHHVQTSYLVYWDEKIASWELCLQAEEEKEIWGPRDCYCTLKIHGLVGRELGIYSMHQHYGQYAARAPQSTLSLPLELPTKQIRTTA